VSPWQRRHLPEELLIPEEVRQHPSWVRLSSQIAEFEDSAKRNSRNYNLTRSVEIIIGAFIPIVALANTSWSRYVAACLGAVIAIMIGVRQLWGSDTLWALHGHTADDLKREQTFFLSLSGPYRSLTQEEGIALLVERSEENISHAEGGGGSKWVSVRRVSSE
jgi:uncharacterized protein DUF4231